jgi:hypothetical protein
VNREVNVNDTLKIISQLFNIAAVPLATIALSARSVSQEIGPDLVNWETIGVAVDHGDGSFTYEDANASRFPQRFYRMVSP